MKKVPKIFPVEVAKATGVAPEDVRVVNQSDPIVFVGHYMWKLVFEAKGKVVWDVMTQVESTERSNALWTGKLSQFLFDGNEAARSAVRAGSMAGSIAGASDGSQAGVPEGGRHGAMAGIAAYSTAHPEHDVDHNGAQFVPDKATKVGKRQVDEATKKGKPPAHHPPTPTHAQGESVHAQRPGHGEKRGGRAGGHGDSVTGHEGVEHASEVLLEQATPLSPAKALVSLCDRVVLFGSSPQFKGQCTSGGEHNRHAPESVTGALLELGVRKEQVLVSHKDEVFNNLLDAFNRRVATSPSENSSMRALCAFSYLNMDHHGLTGSRCSPRMLDSLRTAAANFPESHDAEN